MSLRRKSHAFRRAGSVGYFAAALLVVGLTSMTWAGHTNVGRFGAVGGVSINAEGVVAQPNPQDLKLVREQYLRDTKPAPAELNQPVEMRKISLRAIEEALAKSEQVHTYHMPEEIRFLAGIQRIQYIFVYPEQNDIVLAGPGEGWKVDDKANTVGVTTGRPVLRLEDLIVALRTVENARQGGISVSIDPTAEGRQRFEQYMRSQKTFNTSIPGAIEKALGPQQISVTGVPDNTRFARVMVASDYRMKRIAMKLDESPVAGLPSYLDMLKKGSGKVTNMMPRWWLACDYEPLAKSKDGLAWELRGRGVKVMTEDEIISDDGSVTGTGKVNPIAQKWSDQMTEKYDELSVKDPVFGELRNLMDLCVVAALISKEDLLTKAGLDAPNLTSQNSKVELVHWNAPKTVATESSFVKRGDEFIITASGGVEITSWQAAEKTVEDASVGELRTKAAPKAASLWWN